MRRIAITPGRLALEQDENSFERACAKLAEHAARLAGTGVEAVLLREKDLPPARLTKLAQCMVRALAGSGTRVLLAGPHALHAAQLAGADGLHLGSLNGTPQVEDPRTAWPDAWLTVSTHTVAEATRAAALGVSAILHAPVFGKWIDGKEVVPSLGLDTLRTACTAAGKTPVFALGGVTADNAQACVEAGAAGIAAIRMFGWPDWPG